MKLKHVQRLISMQLTLATTLAIVACGCYYFKLTLSAIILTIVVVLSLILYFVLGLVYWRCPYCHQYLPTKHPGRIKECPHCHKALFEEDRTE